MKVNLICDEKDVQWLAVCKQIELEGDSILREGEVDLELDFRSESIPLQGLSTLGYQVISAPTDFFVSRWFDGSWHPQEFVGVLVSGLMNENLGSEIPAGFGGVYKKVGDVWKPGLANLLREMKVRNFVTLGLTRNLEVTGFQTGIPFPGLFCMLEGFPCRLAEWFEKPRELLESSIIAVTLSRYPFPHQGTSSKVNVEGLSPAVQRHFWMPYVNKHRKGYFTESTLIGVATGWAKTFGEANSRALTSCRAIEVPLKQFRTDVGAEIRKSFSQLGLINQPAHNQSSHLSPRIESVQCEPMSQSTPKVLSSQPDD